jgi:signal transduction histidine kinase
MSEPVAPATAGPEASTATAAGRRAPLRFVWQMDAEHRFTIPSDEFVALMGRATAAALGRPWPELADELALDPEGRVALALASQDTFSGLCIAWPLEAGSERLMVELSGLPVFDRERVFRGHRGFGICRDVARLAALAAPRDAAATGSGAAPQAGGNVVPLHPARAPVVPALSPLERSAFLELTRRLHARLTTSSPPAGSQAADGPPSDLAQAAPTRELTAREAAQDRAPALAAGKRSTAGAASAKSDFLAKVSHEIRTPLNAIIGFAELMAQEKFGPVGNARYRQYLVDIQSSGAHLLALVDDLLDLSRIEAGKLELDFAGVALNPLTRQCVATLQPQANRERILIRTALSPKLPPVIADARSVRQIVLHLVSNATRSTGARGQAIVSTTLTDLGEVVLRVRDSGIGMSEEEIALVREPFRQVATAIRRGPAGTGLGLPLARALAEANGATLRIKSARHAGTLIEVAFPPDRVVVEERR